MVNIKLKTGKTKLSVTKYIQNVRPEHAKDAKTLLKLFKQTTGAAATMWGTSMVGFGEYVYHRSSGDEGRYLATGFSIRASGPVVYILPGYTEFSELMEKLGPHKLGKSCLYLKNLDDIDLKVLAKLITAGLQDLKQTHTVTMK